MSRNLTYLIGPESALTLFSLVLFWFCARHNSGEGRDMALMERLIWLLPFVIAPIAFATIFAPGAKTWWWLGRAILFAYVAIFVCGARVVHGFGSGPKGQDAAFIILIVLGAVAVGIATSISGAMILAETKPGFANWFKSHRVLASVLTLLSAVPIGFALGFLVAVTLGVVGGLYTSFKR